MNNCKLIIIIAKSIKYFFFCDHFLTPLKTFPVTQFWSRERRKLHFRESNFINFPDPPGVCASGTQCSGTNGACPPAKPLHFNYWYFQMLPKPCFLRNCGMMAEKFFVISVHHQEKTLLELIIIMISLQKEN